MITINFASRNYRLLERILTGLIAGGCLLLAAAALIVWSALSLRSEIAAMDRKAAELEKTENEYKPLLLERDRVVKDLSSMSSLMESRRFSWTRFLTSLEAVFPTGVALQKLEYKPRERVLALDGRAHSPEALRNLIVGLERSSEFKDSYLKHQSVDKGSIEFNVVSYYQEQAQAAGVVHGK